MNDNEFIDDILGHHRIGNKAITEMELSKEINELFDVNREM